MNKKLIIGTIYSSIGAFLVCLCSLRIGLGNNNYCYDLVTYIFGSPNSILVDLIESFVILVMCLINIIGFVMLFYGLVMLVRGTIQALKYKDQK